jgi:hypothetical protein
MSIVQNATKLTGLSCNHPSSIFDSIYTVRFTNTIMNILSYNLKLKIQKFPSKFDYKQNINLFGVRFVGVGWKYNTLHVLIFSILPHLCKAILELKSMQF